MNNFQEKANLIWNIADLLRGDYKPRDYVDVILPMTVFRRLDQAMEEKRQAVGDDHKRYRGELKNLDGFLQQRYGRVYNTSPYDWRKLMEAPDDIAQNLVTYLNGFSPDVQDIIEKFDFRRQINRLQTARLIHPILQEFTQVDLHPDRVSNREMGLIFENLIRRFSEQYNETAGEHFTPREVIRLMVHLLFAEQRQRLDAKLREQMRIEIRQLQHRLGTTSVYVTHDQAEAMSISDRIVIMNHGRIEQIGPPLEIYSRPRNRFVADFIGKVNFLSAQVSGPGRVRLAGQELAVDDLPELAVGSDTVLTIRPEAIGLSKSDGQLAGEIVWATFLGGIVEYSISVQALGEITVHQENPAVRGLHEIGETVRLEFSSQALHALPEG
ncbi:MAG: type I restriction-modification system subunit M N-terminal domain-containing protein [Chloroflexota bacterium]|nr:type I restriction-modification system subunit M N-terminal domain-containing protein [Chloroflexota bacterium]